MINTLYFPIDTKLSLLECNQAMEAFREKDKPIVVKMKGTNITLVLVKSVSRDIIKSYGCEDTYSSFLNSIEKMGINGPITLIAKYNHDPKLYYDEKTKLSITPLISSLGESFSSFAQDQGGNILLVCLVKTKYEKFDIASSRI